MKQSADIPPYLEEPLSRIGIDIGTISGGDKFQAALPLYLKEPSSPIGLVCAALYSVRLPANNERELQDGIEKALTAAGLQFHREHCLSRHDRLDFFIEEEGIAIEVKVRTSQSALLRQIKRYSTFDSVRSVVVVSTRPYDLPETLSGKPIIGIALWRSALA